MPSSNMHLHFPSIASAERPATNRSHQLATRLSPPAEERLIDAGSTLSKSTGQMRSPRLCYDSFTQYIFYVLKIQARSLDMKWEEF
jgi:hypothetical protein